LISALKIPPLVQEPGPQHNHNENHFNIVKLLLEHPHIDVNPPDENFAPLESLLLPVNQFINNMQGPSANRTEQYHYILKERHELCGMLVMLGSDPVMMKREVLVRGLTEREQQSDYSSDIFMSNPRFDNWSNEVKSIKTMQLSYMNADLKDEFYSSADRILMLEKKMEKWLDWYLEHKGVLTQNFSHSSSSSSHMIPYNEIPGPNQLIFILQRKGDKDFAITSLSGEEIIPKLVTIHQWEELRESIVNNNVLCQSQYDVSICKYGERWSRIATNVKKNLHFSTRMIKLIDSDIGNTEVIDDIALLTMLDAAANFDNFEMS